MCNRAILEQGVIRYKTQEMCNKSVDNYAHALKFIRDQYKAHGMCIKAVDNYPLQ